MKETLVDALKHVDSMNYELGVLTGLSEQIIDVDKVHTKMIFSYVENPVISNAIKERKTVETAVCELGGYSKGWRKFVPRKKNREFNTRRNNLKVLVEPVPAKSGFFSCDNFVAGATYAGWTIFGMFKLINHYFENLEGDQVSDNILTIQNYLTLGAAFIGGIAAQFGRRVSWGARDDAKYIDSKIRDLGLREHV